MELCPCEVVMRINPKIPITPSSTKRLNKIRIRPSGRFLLSTTSEIQIIPSISSNRSTFSNCPSLEINRMSNANIRIENFIYTWFKKKIFSFIRLQSTSRYLPIESYLMEIPQWCINVCLGKIEKYFVK